MARNKQLLELIAQLRAETGRDQSVSVGIDEVENLKVMLARTQELLFDDHPWLHRRVQKTVALSAGQRYYDLPSGINFDEIEDVTLRYNTIYYPVEKGIDFNDYTMYDSNAATPERSAPVLKWDIRYTGSTEQLEVWPIPNDSTQTLYFFGTESLPDLIQDDDRAVLDDRLIVLYAAHEILLRQKSADARAKLELANKRLSDLKKKAARKGKQIQIGLGQPRNRSNRNGVKVIVS
jgi:hypothetical protein